MTRSKTKKEEKYLVTKINVVIQPEKEKKIVSTYRQISKITGIDERTVSKVMKDSFYYVDFDTGYTIERVPILKKTDGI